MRSILIKDTTRAERAAIVAEAVGNTEGACDGCAPGIIRMYEDYIEGRMELREVTLPEGEWQALLYNETIDPEGTQTLSGTVTAAERTVLLVRAK